MLHVCVRIWPCYHMLLLGTASGLCPLLDAALLLAGRGEKHTACGKESREGGESPLQQLELNGGVFSPGF